VRPASSPRPTGRDCRLSLLAMFHFGNLIGLYPRYYRTAPHAGHWGIACGVAGGRQIRQVCGCARIGNAHGLVAPLPREHPPSAPRRRPRRAHGACGAARSQAERGAARPGQAAQAGGGEGRWGCDRAKTSGQTVVEGWGADPWQRGGGVRLARLTGCCGRQGARCRSCQGQLHSSGVRQTGKDDDHTPRSSKGLGTP